MKDEIIKSLKQGMNLFDEAIKKLQAMEGKPPSELDDLMPYQEAMKRVGISRSTLYKMEKEGAITIHRMSPRKLYVSISELVQAIKNH